jgi:prolyl-tRNA synthetase
LSGPEGGCAVRGLEHCNVSRCSLDPAERITSCRGRNAALTLYLFRWYRVNCQIDGRTRASNMFIPQVKWKSEMGPAHTSHSHGRNIKVHKVVDVTLRGRDGAQGCSIEVVLTKSSPGVFHMLPLGLRVQEKICKLADAAMKRVGSLREFEWADVGAAKMELPALSPFQLWVQSGRWLTGTDEVPPQQPNLILVISSQNRLR